MSHDDLQHPMFRIDPFRPADLPTIAAFVEAIQEHERANNCDLKPGAEINPSYVEMLVRNVASRQGTMLMARTDGETVGFVCAWQERDNDPLLREEAQARAYVSDIFVVDRWRRVGVGRLLLDAIEAEMAARGCRRMCICSKANNGAALRSYELAGFRRYEIILAKRIG
jgi:ribosomal protein S18 acetylase RimI-like enzyme